MRQCIHMLTISSFLSRAPFVAASWKTQFILLGVRIRTNKWDFYYRSHYRQPCQSHLTTDCTRRRARSIMMDGKARRSQMILLNYELLLGSSDSRLNYSSLKLLSHCLAAGPLLECQPQKTPKDNSEQFVNLKLCSHTNQSVRRKWGSSRKNASSINNNFYPHYLPYSVCLR